MRENTEVMTTKDVAEALKISVWQAQEMCRRNQLPHFHIGRFVRIPRREFYKWMQGRVAEEKKKSEGGGFATPDVWPDGVAVGDSG